MNNKKANYYMLIFLIMFLHINNSCSNKHSQDIETNDNNINRITPFSEGVIFQNVDIHLLNGKATISGETNLPDDTNLISDLEMTAGGIYFAQGETTVKQNSFALGPFSSHNKPLPIGKYKLSITVPYSFTQPESVKRIIGDLGQNLKGPLVIKRDDVFGTIVEYNIEFVVGASGIKYDSVKNTENNTSSAEHLIMAKEALADGYKYDKDPMKTSWGRVYDAKEHLLAIKEGDNEYKEAQNIMEEVIRREKGIYKVSESIVLKETAEKRKKAAIIIENNFLESGLDIEVSVGGENNTILYLEYVLFTRATIYPLVNKSDFLEVLKSNGFKKVVFSNKYDKKWNFDVE